MGVKSTRTNAPCQSSMIIPFCSKAIRKRQDKAASAALHELPMAVPYNNKKYAQNLKDISIVVIMI